MAGDTVGGPALLERFYLQFHGEIYGYIAKKINNRDVAQDLAAEVFAHLAQIADLSSIKYPRGYLFTAARSVIINWLDYTSRRHPELTVPLPDETDEDYGVIDETSAPDRRFEGAEQLDIMRETIDSLSPKCRAVFIMIRFEGKTHKEAGAALGLGNKVMEYYVKQALTKIKDRFEEAGY